MYRNHIEHHNHRHFGTPSDGEYLPLGSSPVIETLKYLAQAPLLPLLMVVRFGVLGPVSWLHPGLREWVLTRASAAVSNPYYSKRFPRRDEAHLRVVEVLCFAYLVVIAVLLWRGSISTSQLFMGYLLLAFTLGLNWVRNLAAHRYVNGGQRMTMAEQVAESINITGQTWLTVAMFPVGLRYHALHHMFPALPYHHMGEAHRRLMQGLPADAPYRATNRASFFAAVRELWQSARQTLPERSAMRAWLPSSGRS
jgi:fatty acid desaturase